MEFVIFEDLQKNTSAVKIHLKSCYYYTHHEPTDTTDWHDSKNYEQAKVLAKRLAKGSTKGWRNANCYTGKAMKHV